jgi:hypothetical protein
MQQYDIVLRGVFPRLAHIQCISWPQGFACLPHRSGGKGMAYGRVSPSSARAPVNIPCPSSHRLPHQYEYPTRRKASLEGNGLELA